MTLKTLGDLSAELHKSAEHRKQYRLQKPFYDLTLEILNRRKKLGLTQKELAKRIGTHQSAISRIESAEHNSRLGTLVQIAEALETWLEIKLVPNLHLNDEDYELFQVSGHSSSSQKSYTSSTEQESIEFSV
jgi:transcriptional regulator with XRE-family HTH domain